MSSRSATTLRQNERVARHSTGQHTGDQLGRPLDPVIVDPAQLMGPRARTRIRPGAAMTIGGAMDPNAITVGVDVSKAELVVAVHPSGERWVSGTSAAAVDALVDRLVRLHPVLVVVEATGGYERALVAACATAQVPIAVINPRQVRAFAQAIGRTAKTDATDAALLALFAARVRPEPRTMA